MGVSLDNADDAERAFDEEDDDEGGPPWKRGLFKGGGISTRRSEMDGEGTLFCLVIESVSGDEILVFSLSSS